MPDNHSHGHGHPHGHGPQAHQHGWGDPAIASTARGMRAIKWSCVGLLATAGLQLVVVLFSGSVALLADTLHNLGDAATALPLWLAFTLRRRPPSDRFPYGYGRVEDLAGIAIVLIMAATAVFAGYESITRLFQPHSVAYLGTVAVAAVIGFIGNEAVALFRIKVGREIASAALIADGYHARVDGWTSLAVLVGALGVWLGYPPADALVGLLITMAIFWLVWQAGAMVLIRVVDGIDPEIIAAVKHTAQQIPGVEAVAEVQARWLGHYLRAEVNVAVRPALSITAGHAIAKEVRHQLLHQVPSLSDVTVHVDPLDEAGEQYHRVTEHAHDDLPAHSH